MKKMTVDDIVARLLMRQKIVVLEGDANPQANRLCDETTVSYYEDGLWRTLGKRTVRALDVKNDVLYIYVEELGDK